MKNIILGAVAATALLATNISVTKSVHAADSSHCNVLDHGPEFNKTELSAFDKCWINTHRADKKSGISGNVFWIKVGDDFVSMPAKKLYQSGSKQAAKEMVKEKIIERIVEVEITKEIEVIRERTVEVERELTTAQQQAITYVGNFLSNPTGNKATIRSFLATGNTNSEHGNFSFYDSQSRLVNAAEAWDSAVTAHGHLQVLTSVVEELTTQLNGIAALSAAHTRVANDISNLTATDAYTIERNGRTFTFPAKTKLQNIQSYVAGLNKGLTAGDNYNATVPTSNNVGVTENANGNDGTNIFGANHTGSFPSKSAYAVLTDGTRLENPYTVRTTAGAITLLAETVYDYAFDKGYLEGFEEGYNQGYSDGYSDGYNEGYADGFADGVASTQ